MAEVDARKVAGLYFRKLKDRYLLTNDWGLRAILSPRDFERFLGGTLEAQEPLWKDLQAKGFIRDHIDFAGLAKAYRQANAFLWQGPSLNILVVTLRCNHKCLYCHSSAVNPSRADADMSLETAQAAVDLIFKNPNPHLAIEFQGGEPLLNWPVVEFVIGYARKKNETEKRKLLISLVSNMSLMDERKLNFLLDHEVSLCTSLDGPRDLHEKNRPFVAGASHAHVERWITELTRRHKEERSPKKRIFKPSALMTTTKFSLPRVREIIDEYVRLGLDDIFLRPLSPIGYAKKTWPKIGYSAFEFLEFYRQGVDYLLELNLRGVDMPERTAVILLTKILRGKDPGFVDLRSPCGAAVGQLAFNYDGAVYTCDEGRMVAQQGDDLFKVGRVGQNTFQELVSSPACRVLCAASNMDGAPACSRCAYKPYCGLCPVHNYEAQGSIWGRMPAGDYCAVHMGLFDYLFERLENPEYERIFKSWTNPREGEKDGIETQAEIA